MADDDKFGQKMLEKMGWEKGKGLGAKLDGNVDHISVRAKNDQKGMMKIGLDVCEPLYQE